VTICAAKSLNGVLAEMTRYRRHLKPVCLADASLPVVYNEYMHFSWDDPNEERAIANAPAVAAAGAKYYIIDCGWHNARAADSTPVMYKLFGTWYEDRGRFPHGIKYVSDYMHSLGMGFGLWLAPEVVGKENHEMLAYYEDECFIRKNGFKVANDTGYLLDFRHPKVVDYMTKTIDRMVNEYGCDYIKFDGCPNPGMHAEIDDAYAAFTDWSLSMTHRHPNVIFEDCAGGGQRTDYKALSIFHLLSTSDQTNYLHYPYITANIMVSALPEQAGVWSYPVDVDLFDPAKPQNTNERITKERVALNMVNAILCRIHLASRLFLLDEEKLALIREGVTFYESIIEAKKKAVPYLPLGYAKFGDTLVSVGIKAEDKLYLAVWNLGGNQDVTLPLPEIKVKNATVAYPTSLPTDFTYTQDSITVRFTENVQARIFEITLA
jgi:alpha-galactosidase